MTKQTQSLEDSISNRSLRSSLKSLFENSSDLEKFESVRRWLSRVRQDGTGSEKTSYAYLRHLNIYCGYWQRNPDQLIEERERELKNEQEKVKRRAEEMLREFCDYLELKAGLSGATMQSALTQPLSPQSQPRS